ncbi:MAG: class I SAM-dependent methyltransferase [Alphaproteobacteria bacterium]|nr:MAG: class I SAM-dependent methyltransferase [Alphaproteobacteria bacterium]
MTIAEFMTAALLDPIHGYYAKQDPFGPQGDFITAPEVSQMFGELIGLWAAETWIAMGAPESVQVIELGPGRGTLQADFQRAIARALPPFWQALNLYMVEASPTLTTHQQKTLEGKTHAPATWVSALADVPEGPMILIANEFLDALPVHHFEHLGGTWHERRVGLDVAGALAFVTGKANNPASLPAALAASAQEGDIWEECPAAHETIAQIASRFTRHPGTALLIDYGHAESGFGETLQAVRSHEYAEVLAAPGDADLTTHVDFAALATTAHEAGARAAPLMTQGNFLTALGIQARAQALKQQADPDTARKIDIALDRLIGPDQMGRLFKVLTLHSKTVPTPPGFMAE